MKKYLKRSSKDKKLVYNINGVFMSYRMKEIPINERPRERLKIVGVNNLTDKEILSILLKTGTYQHNVFDVSIELLNKYSLADLENVSLDELTIIKGIGEVKAIELLAAIELGKRIVLRKNTMRKKLENARAIWEDARYLFYNLQQENFYAYYFNNKQELINRKLIFMGTVNCATTHTRDIFREAIKVNATTIVCLHNHPSGDVTPSKADMVFTERLMKTGEIQGIPVVDHIIIGDNTYYSFYEHRVF